MSNQANYVAAAVATAGVISGAYYAYQTYKESHRQTVPTQWKQVGTLKDMYIYPIKSCAPVVMDTAECSLLGLRDGWLRDRVLMVVDEKNNFVTARAHPEMLLIKPTVRNSVLTLAHADFSPVHVNLAEVVAVQKPVKAWVWGIDVQVYDCGKEVSEWISRILDKSTTSFHLMYYASDKSRPIREKATNKFFKFTKNDVGALPDETSYNLINDASVDDLNLRLKDGKASPLNFRPNFVLEGAGPFDEDKWTFIKIGDNIFEIVKPCTRCILTTIDPETGVRSAKSEPLETLKSYRQIEDPDYRRAAGNSPRMGVQMTLRSPPGGVVSINDIVYVA